jgi:ABC-2 type transport system ATP-binding protein
MIETQGLTKRYGTATALDAVTMKVPDGSIGLLGENGAGKTTLIKLLLGLLHATEGSARVLGLDIAHESLELRRRVGYMPEDDCLPLDITAMDFVSRMGMISGLPKSAAVQRTHDVLHLVGISEERFRPLGTYSTGMKQKAKLAQALIHDPKLVLLDEPTVGMDPKGREEMLELIKDIRQKMNLQILISTHLLGDVERICDSVVIVRGGQLVAQGTLQELLGEVTESLHVRATGPIEEFTKRLRRENLRVEIMGNQLTIGYESDTVYSLIMKHAAETNVQIHRLEREAPTLEDFFIKLHEREKEEKNAIAS